MIHFHYCKNYLDNSNSEINNAVSKSLDSFLNRNRLKGGGKLMSFTKKIFVLRLKTPYCEVILQEKDIEIESDELIVYFVRGFKSGLQDYVEIRDGKWLKYNELSQADVSEFKIEYAKSIEEISKRLPPPRELIDWQSDYTLKVEYNIFETEDWIKYAMSDSLGTGMRKEDSKLYLLAIKDILREHVADGLCENSFQTKIFERDDIAIIYTWICIGENSYYLLHNGANKKNQLSHWNSVKDYSLDKNQKFNTFHDVSSLASKAYPDWTLNDADLWIKIEKNNELGNLSLLPEQTDFLKGFRFPKYINGQAGSGKSTMLYYLFANAYYYKCAGEIKGDIIFLTENEKLLDHTKSSVYDLLLNNPEFDLSTEHVAIAKVDQYFFSFKKFLLQILPDDQRLFLSEKYLDFSRFKKLYTESNIHNHIKSKYSAELVWFTISTYVFGDSLSYNITSDNYEEKMPKEGKELISRDDLKRMEDSIIRPFYDKLVGENEFWDKIKLIKYINENVRLTDSYDVVFCDEAQDFSRVELEFILKLSSYTKYDLQDVVQFPVVFAGDALQTVSPTGFRSEALTAMIYKELTSEEIGFNFDQSSLVFTPTFNYRSSQSIVNVANAIQNYRKHKFSVNIQHPQTSKRPVLYKNEHLNVFVDFESFIQDETLQEKVRYKTIILPVNNDEIESFKSRNIILNDFSNLISPIEAKGLDFNEVVIFGFGDYISREDWGLYEKRFFYNKLYVSVTRAQAELVIIDSKESQTSFWEPLIQGYLDSDWATGMNPIPSSLSDILIFDSGEIIESSIDIVQSDAFRQQNQGRLEGNVALLQVASSHFIKLGNKKEYYISLALIEEINENWSKASELYSKKEVGSEGLNLSLFCLWRGKLWTEFVDKVGTGVKLDDETRLMKIISESVLNKKLSDNNLKIIFDRQRELRKILNSTSWSDEILELFVKLMQDSFDKDRINQLAELVTENATKNNNEILSKVGDKFYLNQQYQQAIATFEYGGIVSEIYFRSKLEIALKRQNFEEIIIYSGEIFYLTGWNDEEAIIEIINTYKDNDLFDQELNNIYVDLYAQIALVYNDDYEGVFKLSSKVEGIFSKESRQAEVADHYRLLLLEVEGLGSRMTNFILMRWLRISIDGGYTINDINHEYKNIALKRGFKDIPFSEAEISNIPQSPTDQNSSFSEHIFDLEIYNFKKFECLKVSNLGLVNLIVGDNNIGKTSFLEALLFTPKKIDYMERLAFAHVQRMNVHPDKKDSSEGVSWYYNLDDQFLEEYENSKKPEENMKFRFYSKRTFSEFSVSFKSKNLGQKNELISFNIDDYLSLKNIPYLNSVNSPIIYYGKGFGSELARIYENEVRIDRDLEKDFLNNLKLFIPDLEGIYVRLDGSIDVREKSSSKDKPLHQYGDGANKLFRILLLLSLHKGKRLLIDEIDAGIHFSRFKEFWRILIELAKKNDTQLFATTHNEECVDFFTEVLKEETMSKKLREKSRVIQMKLVNNDIKVRSFEFESFNLAYEDGVELRGGKS